MGGNLRWMSGVGMPSPQSHMRDLDAHVEMAGDSPNSCSRKGAPQAAFQMPVWTWDLNFVGSLRHLLAFLCPPRFLLRVWKRGYVAGVGS